MLTRLIRPMSAVLLAVPVVTMFAQAPAAAPVAPSATPQPVADASHPGTFLLTVFLRHDESKTVSQINEELKRNGWYKNFPPKGVEIVSWNVVMGIGQVVTLRVPAEKLRETNLVFENSAWGGYRTEFYPTYVFPWESVKKSMMDAPAAEPAKK
jgi:hypothetical protein